MYRTTQPFDPEGVLGTINSIVMGFMGMQVSKPQVFDPIFLYRFYQIFTSVVTLKKGQRFNALLRMCFHDISKLE